MKKLIYLSIFAAFALSCERELDSPPVNSIDGSQIVTIDSLRNWQASSVTGKVSIQENLSVYAVVSMDESSGNIYKNLYVQDHTAGINLRMTKSSDFRVGDSLRIALKGAVLSVYSGVIQLDSINPDTQIIKQSSGNNPTPIVKALNEITLDDEAKLIRIENVQFMAPELSFTFADAVNQSSKNRMLEDCSGNSIIVRTSGYANYAGTQLPQGNGSMVCIVNRFNDEIQLIIRSFEEVKLTGTRCAGLLFNKDFDDNSITSGGWIVQQVTGTQTWITSTAGGAPEPYGSITGWNGSANTLCESWLISPSIDLSASSTPTLNFENAYKYTGAPLQLLISTNYSGTGDPNGATWTALTANWSTGNFIWANSGTISLSAFLQSNVRIAFKYTSTTSAGSTWEVDDIKVTG